MSFGQETSSQTANKLRSTFIYGNLGVFDKSDGSILSNTPKFPYMKVDRSLFALCELVS